MIPTTVLALPTPCPQRPQRTETDEIRCSVVAVTSVQQAQNGCVGVGFRKMKSINFRAYTIVLTTLPLYDTVEDFVTQA
jgi:hypothetical protein